MGFLKFRLVAFSILVLISTIVAQKQVYIPRFITNTGMDLNNEASQWSYKRSVETANFVIFWEAGFGSDPATATGSYKVNMAALKEAAEKSYTTYVDSLKMVLKGSSVVDQYKVMIFLLYSTEWAAYGSGQDDKVGTLHVNPAAANINTVVAHEIGHTFQYLTGCDSPLGGFRYGFGANASGGNGFWEQIAQWLAVKAYPNQQFTMGDFNEYIANNHKHLIHETPRYANYFIGDFWAYKKGADFMGKLWRDSRKPEDPIEAYKRLTNTSQEVFTDEMYDHAARLTTWDLPAIKSYGANYITRRAQVKMTLNVDKYWVIDSNATIENYGYNSIKLNAPTAQTNISVNFKGLAGTKGFRTLNLDKAGWRFGFVALLKDGTRTYSPMTTAKYSSGKNPDISINFTVPANCDKLWFVVSGAPQEHWRHAWDDDDSNDEQWPYQVQFTNTNLLGEPNPIPAPTGPLITDTMSINVTMKPLSAYTPQIVELDAQKLSTALQMSTSQMSSALGNTLKYYALNANKTLDSVSTAYAPGHWYTQNGQAVAYGAQAYVYSELNLNLITANIGQYPDRAKLGDKYTIRQKLVHTKSASEVYEVILKFEISISDDIPVSNLKRPTLAATSLKSFRTFNVKGALSPKSENGMYIFTK